MLQQHNVMKVDIGVHVNGRIIDSAFTTEFDPMYDNLLAAVKDATNTGVRVAGIDVRIGELGGHIQEALRPSAALAKAGFTIRVKSRITPYVVMRQRWTCICLRPNRCCTLSRRISALFPSVDAIWTGSDRKNIYSAYGMPRP